MPVTETGIAVFMHPAGGRARGTRPRADPHPHHHGLQSKESLQSVWVPVLSGLPDGSAGSSSFGCRYAFRLPSGTGRMPGGIQRIRLSGDVYGIPKKTKDHLAGLPLHGAVGHPE